MPPNLHEHVLLIIADLRLNGARAVSCGDVAVLLDTAGYDLPTSQVERIFLDLQRAGAIALLPVAEDQVQLHRGRYLVSSIAPAVLDRYLNRSPIGGPTPLLTT